MMTPNTNLIFLLLSSEAVEPEEPVELEEPAEPEDPNTPAEPEEPEELAEPGEPEEAEDPNKPAEPVKPRSHEWFDDMVVVVEVVAVVEVGSC